MEMVAPFPRLLLQSFAYWFLFYPKIPKILLIDGVFSIKIDLSLSVLLQKTVVLITAI